MLAKNIRQKEFYESRSRAYQGGQWVHEQAANLPTNLWTRLRNLTIALRKEAGAQDLVHALHREWLGDIRGSRILDLGCAEGNPFTLWMAENCAEYIGTDLSERWTASLNAKLRERGLSRARAYAGDFLKNSFPDDYFDVVYAHAVLHHFEHLDVLLEELRRVLKPGGSVIAFDPLQTEPLNRLARCLYRPLQSDRDWEYPFSRDTFGLLGRYFDIAAVQGVQGMIKLGYPLLLIPPLRCLGRALCRWGQEFDRRHATQPGPWLFFCWNVTLRLVKRAGAGERPSGRPEAVE